MRLRLLLILVPTMIATMTTEVRPQGFRGIVPLESTCDDVKSVLGVESCDRQQSTYFLKDVVVTVTFVTDSPDTNEKLCYRVPVSAVRSIIVSYNRPLNIEELEYELKLEKEPFGDDNATLFVNKEKGVTVYVYSGMIRTAIFGPTPKQHINLSRRCKKAEPKTL